MDRTDRYRWRAHVGDGAPPKATSKQEDLQAGLALIRRSRRPPNALPQTFSLVGREGRRDQGEGQDERAGPLERIDDEVVVRHGKGGVSGIIAHPAVGYFEVGWLQQLDERARKVSRSLRLTERHARERGDQAE
jgi:hypothetical protein